MAGVVVLACVLAVVADRQEIADPTTAPCRKNSVIKFPQILRVDPRAHHQLAYLLPHLFPVYIEPLISYPLAIILRQTRE